MVKVREYPVLIVLRCVLETPGGTWVDRRNACRYIVCGQRHNACSRHFGPSGFCDGDTQFNTKLAFGVDGVETPWRICLDGSVLIERSLGERRFREMKMPATLEELTNELQLNYASLFMKVLRGQSSAGSLVIIHRCCISVSRLRRSTSNTVGQIMTCEMLSSN